MIKLYKFKEYQCKIGSDMGGFKDDVVEKVGMDFPEAYTHWGGIAKISKVVRENNEMRFSLLPFCHTVEAENYGGNINLGNAKIGPRCATYIYESSEDLKDLPDLDFNKGRLFEVLKAITKLKSEGENVCVNIAGPMTTLNNLMDPGKIFRIWRKEPAVITAVVEKIRLQLLLYIEELLKEEVDLISFEDPVGGLNILGPKYFEELGKNFSYPFVKDTIKLIDGRCILHLCPKTSLQLIALELAQWNEIELEKEHTYESAYLYLKGKISLVGGICIHNRNIILKNKKMKILNLI